MHHSPSGRHLLAAVALASFGFTGSPVAAETVPAAKAGLAVRDIALPGDGRGDYLLADEKHRLLFVTHATRVHVLDLDTLQQVATVVGFRSVHGVALSAGRAFATDGGAGEVVVFDPRSGMVSQRIKVGLGPDSIATEPVSGRVIAFNGYGKSASVIDPTTLAVVSSIDLGARPEFARADGRGHVLVNLSNSAEVAEIDPVAGRVVRKYKVAGCEDPSALGIDEAARRIFVGCGNRRMQAVALRSAKVVGGAPIGDDADGIVYDPARRRIYAANRDGTLSVISKRGAVYKMEASVALEDYAKTLAFDSRTGRLFSSTAEIIRAPVVAGRTPPPTAKPGTFHLVVISPVASHP